MPECQNSQILSTYTLTQYGTAGKMMNNKVTSPMGHPCQRLQFSCNHFAPRNPMLTLCASRCLVHAATCHRMHCCPAGQTRALAFQSKGQRWRLVWRLALVHMV